MRVSFDDLSLPRDETSTLHGRRPFCSDANTSGEVDSCVRSVEDKAVDDTGRTPECGTDTRPTRKSTVFQQKRRRMRETHICARNAYLCAKCILVRETHKYAFGGCAASVGSRPTGQRSRWPLASRVRFVEPEASRGTTPDPIMARCRRRRRRRRRPQNRIIDRDGAALAASLVRFFLFIPFFSSLSPLLVGRGLPRTMQSVVSTGLVLFKGEGGN